MQNSAGVLGYLSGNKAEVFSLPLEVTVGNSTQYLGMCIGTVR